MKNLILILSVAFTSSFANAQNCATSETIKNIQRQTDLVAANIANVNTTRTPDGGPYQRQLWTCDSSNCQVTKDPRTKMKYLPDSPDADENGYVAFPNIDLMYEINQMLVLEREYQIAKADCQTQ